MKYKPQNTTQINKPDSSDKPYAPQTPDTNRPDIGRPAKKVTKSKKKKMRPDK